MLRLEFLETEYGFRKLSMKGGTTLEDKLS